MKVVLYHIVFFSLLFLGTAQAQKIKKASFYNKEEDKVREIYHLKSADSAVLEGEYIAFYLNGNIEKKGSYKNNIPVGTWEFRYENGNVKMTGSVVNGVNEGFWMYFYENGKKKMEGNVLGGKQNGLWVFYYLNGAEKSKGRFVEGTKTGEWVYLSESGYEIAKATYTDGEGLYYEYYPSGIVLGVGMKINNKKEGDWTYYHENGVKMSIGRYTNDRRTGHWQYFNQSALLEYEGEFVLGEKSGDWEYYFANGKTKSKGGFKKDKRNGQWNIFNELGNIQAKGTYENGTGPYEAYYSSGEIKTKGFFKNDLYDSTWTFYNIDGSIEGICKYKKGIGQFTGFYPSGKIKTKGTYKADKKTGTWELYNEDGTLAGYYRPVYEPRSMVSAPKNPKIEYGVGSYKYKKKENRYFKKGINEFVGLYLGVDAISNLIGRLPLTAEMYFQERLGYQMEVVVIRDPFYTSADRAGENEIYSRGIEVNIKQKFYHPDKLFGMWYFGHQLGVVIEKHGAKIKRDPLDLELTKVNANEYRYQYGVILGYRYLMDTKGKGWSLDGHIGLNLGYRDFIVDQQDAIYFDQIPQNNFAFTPAFSISIGYMFSQNRKKR